MESCMVLIDNSEWTRSGDYAPSRFQSQADAVNLLAGAKTQAHPENTVGVLSMAGKTPKVLVTPTPDLGKVLTCMTEIGIDGECNLSAAVQIAQLALKHRQNKNQRQRIVLFVGSPITEDKDKLIKMAKRLKKNNVAVDVVSFGEAANCEKLEAFHSAVNSNGNSHLVEVPPGPVLSDVLIGSPIFQGEGGGGYGFAGGVPGGPAAGGGEGGYEFGVDPNMDPELALALRVSLEEERARQNAVAATTTAPPAADGTAAAAAGADGGTAVGPNGGVPTPFGDVVAATAVGMGPEEMDMDEDALLQQALAMSMGVDAPDEAAAVASSGAMPATPAQPPPATPMAPSAPLPAAVAAAPPTSASNAALLEGVDDEELALALSMSMQEAEPESKESK